MHANVILATLSVAGLAYAVLSSAVIPALPTLQHDLHTTETGVTWLLTGFLLSASVGTAIIGRLGDMYGKERLLLWTLLILGVGSLLGGLATTLPVLIVARVIQGVAGGIFPLAFSITRDEFPPERVPGSIGLISSILGVGGGLGLVLGGLIVEHLSWHWLFWLPLGVTILAAVFTWRFIPESPVRSPGHVNWLAAALMSVAISCILIAVAQTTVWGWGGAKTIALFAIGVLFCAAWVAVEVRSREPLIDMTLMRIRGVWTTNLVAFLLGAGMYASFIIYPQFAQLPTSTGFGFGASVVVSSLYLLPAAVGMGLLGTAAGKVARRFGSKPALLVGTAITAISFIWLADRPRASVRHADLRGVARNRDRARVRGAREPGRPGRPTEPDRRRDRNEHGDANARRRARGSAVSDIHRRPSVPGLPTVTGFNETFVMAAAFLVVCLLAGLLVPGRRPASATIKLDPQFATTQD